MKKQKLKAITWVPKKVPINKIKKTPRNFKIENSLGRKRLMQSLDVFGNASTVILNTDYCLIDGNSRLEEEKKRKSTWLWVMWPSRKLSPKEYREMCAMFDYAVAGEVDTERIHQELGTSKEFFDQWHIEMPMNLLDKIGKKSKGIDVDVKGMKYPDKVKDAVTSGESVVTIYLFYSVKLANQFRKEEDRLAKKYGLSNISDIVLQAMKKAK